MSLSVFSGSWVLGQAESATPLLAWWIVFPLAGLTLLVIAAHVAAIRESEGMPASRRRIRTVNGVLMMGTVPLIAYAFGVATSADARTFTLVWMLIIGLLAIIIVVAWLDAMNTVRLHRATRLETRERLAELRGQVAAQLELERQEKMGQHGSESRATRSGEHGSESHATGEGGS